MIDYYKEKLANLREVFRAVMLIFIALISGEVSLVFVLLKNGLIEYFFVLFNVGFILIILMFMSLIKLYNYMNKLTNEIKEENV